ncbi:hypothetical protein YC2023_078428 [Brassica napus]|uniref:Uncharacterized protein n=2 Tax=Brassica TaxID=3705 RepID=A0A0D3CVU2_BRAOL|nr:unnamed protein product [Brassica napus]
MSATEAIMRVVVCGVGGPRILKKCSTASLTISSGEDASIPVTLMRIMIELKAFLALATMRIMININFP